ncbi:ketoacyl-ACP synthase III [candidate division KSB1 bacterium]|nr:ketoacyl-ACP synthase III [candidate division KSB1 bacterium]RQW07311.1 MAG: ketoacyl-ACP synthase III [candidate division KSB1 bacterium]
MRNQPAAKIVGTGASIPEKVLTNFDLEKMVDTTDEWITSRTGIETRYIVQDGQCTSDLGTEAALRALKDARVKAKEVDVIIFATITSDVGFPATAVFVQKNIGAHNAAAFDIQATCTGFIYGLEMADAFIATRRAKTVLLIGGETLSRITDYSDRNTCVLFGDGAGAAVLQPSDDDRGILATYTRSDGRLHNLLMMEGMGTKNPPTAQNYHEKMQYIQMEGRDVFKHAVTCMGDAAEMILVKAGLSQADVDLLIPHQANIRIIDATAKRIKLPPEKVYVNVNKYGNTSAASIPIAIDEARRNGRLKQGDVAILVAFGGGFTWGSAAVRF